MSPTGQEGNRLALFETTFPPYVAFGSRLLRLQTPNLRGTDVAVLQAIYNLMLQVMNPPLGPMGSRIALDGIFGPQTRHAVLNIQSYFGLTVDGIAGPQTYFVFGQGVGPNTTYGGPVYGSRQLVQGMSGGDVRILQNRLNCFRYASFIGQPATGFFDAATAQAVLRFKHDAAANGDSGFLNNAIAGFGFYDASWLYTFAGGRGIFTGRNGFDVAFVQFMLMQLGFYGGPVHGYYDAATRTAVIAFQSAQGIVPDGVVGPVTFYNIGLRNPVPAPLLLPISWPSTPPARVDCCAVFTPPGVPLTPEGGSLWLRQQGSAYQLVATAVNLPPPHDVNPTYIGYFLTLPDVVLPMTQVSVPLGLWTEEFSSPSGAPLPSSTIVSINPGFDTEHYGDPILLTTIGDCTS